MIRHRQPALLLLFSFAGLCFSLGLAGHIVQPDWSLALLTAALLSYRSGWPWLIPGVVAHDVSLYWTVWGALPLAAAIPYLLLQIDRELGTALMWRAILMGVVCLPILWLGSGFMQWLMTLMLCVPLWHALTKLHARLSS